MGIPDSLPTPLTEAGRAGLAALLERPARAVVALDFDGTLAPIVPDPDQARAHPDAVPALTRLSPLVGSVAVVTGRPASVAVRYGGFEGATGLDHLVVLGHYGAERWDAATGTLRAPEAHPGVAAVRAELPGVLEGVLPGVLGGGEQGADGTHAGGPYPGGTHSGGAYVEDSGAYVEDKGRAVAVHTRRAEDPQAAFEALRGPLHALAERHGLIVEPGRLVLELRPPGMDKGVALEAYVREVGAAAVLYAGDDLGDLAAFAAVEKLRAEGVAGVLVCSGSAEVTELAARADVVVDGPEGTVALLSTLAAALPH